MKRAEARSDTSPLRADARRNREQILAAARDVFVEQGAGAPLDEIARRAGVGIATLYRRFPDRRSLMRELALDVLRRSAQEARLALAEESDAFQALVRYMHRAVDLRIGAVMPAIVGEIPMEDEEILRAREESSRPIQEMIDRAQADGRLRPDVAFGDIGLTIIRLTRPLPGPLPRDLDRRLAHRHLDVLIDGLRAASNRSARRLSGPALTLEDLRAIAPDPQPSTSERSTR